MSRVKGILILVFYFGVFGALDILSIVWTVRSIAHGEYLTAFVVLCFFVSMFALMAYLVVVLRANVRPRVEYGDEATTVRPYRTLDWLTKIGTITAYGAAATYAIFTPMGKIDIPQPPGNHQYLLYLATGGAVWGIFDLWRTFRRGGVSYIRLTPNGFDMSQGSSSVSGVWDEVADVSDRRPGKSPPFRGMVFVVFKEDRVRSLVVDSYTPRGTAMRRLVRYYWMNPERRDELTDGRAAERLAQYLA